MANQNVNCNFTRKTQSTKLTL